MTPSQDPNFSAENTAERAAALARLSAARRSMVTSAIFSVLLLGYLVWRVSANYANPQLRGNNSVLLVIGLVVLARLGYSGYRLYNKWKELKAAQEHHRSLS